MEPQETVSAEEFFKLDLRVGRITESTPLENSDKLIKFNVDFGEGGVRTIIAGLKPFYPPESFLNHLFVFAYNLAPRKMAGETSEGMLLCVDPGTRDESLYGAGGEKPQPLEAPEGTREGERVK